MKLEQKIKQQQKLILSQHMQQFLHLLQMSNLELLEEAKKELDENPFLIEEERPQFESFKNERRHFENDSSLENLAKEEGTFLEELESQILMTFHDNIDQKIALYFVQFLDEVGYFREDLVALAEHLGTDVGHLERILKVLQTFDPPGIFARDLQECFKLQFENQKTMTPKIDSIINQLDLLLSKDFKDIIKASGYPLEDIQDTIQKLRGLDPKPGFQDGLSSKNHIIPDVYFEPDEMGKWNLYLNSYFAPRYSFNNDFFQTIKKQDFSEKEQAFVTEKYNSATGLIKAIQQRNETLLRVAREIVEHQKLFFTQGILMKPLTLKVISESLGIHESTASRACAHKYIATPRGTFELKFFFQSGVRNDDGDGFSAAHVVHKIKSFIAQESPQKPYSDEDLSTFLSNAGIPIARRTVAKYREEAGIPSSSKRRGQNVLQFKTF